MAGRQHVPASLDAEILQNCANTNDEPCNKNIYFSNALVTSLYMNILKCPINHKKYLNKTSLNM